jgi:hypothetical protein
MLKVITESGAIYYIADDGVVTGGSLKLTKGQLWQSAMVGRSLLISTPERAEQNPDAFIPAVMSTPIVSLEVIE